jgi:asparagine N-glycosylation enzyme membrane subunit Stt3
MWQRIQTVWWLLGILFCIVILFFSYFNLSTIFILQLIFLGFASICILINLISIFLFKKRNVQKKLSLVNIILSLLAILIQVYFLDIQSLNNWIHIVGFQTILFIFHLLFQILAIKGINADVKVLKSMDRLR